MPSSTCEPVETLVSYDSEKSATFRKALKKGISTPLAIEEVNALEKAVGHGIEVYHQDFGHEMLAAVAGFGWMHEPGSPARVEVPRASDTRMRQAIREAVEAADDYVNQRKVRHPKVRFWLNA